MTQRGEKMAAPQSGMRRLDSSAYRSCSWLRYRRRGPGEGAGAA